MSKRATKEGGRGGREGRRTGLAQTIAREGETERARARLR